MINYNFFGKDCVIDQDLNDRTDLNQKLNDLNFKFGEVLILNQVDRRLSKYIFYILQYF